jgi:hypothetical protein
MKTLKKAVCFILPLAIQNVIAAPIPPETVSSFLPPFEKSLLIEGSYIVTFNAPVGAERPFIEAADLNKKNAKGFVEVPFGEHSTSQSKQDIEKQLGLNGKVNRIYETINAVHVLMDAKEAYRLSLDKRVKSVDQDGTASVSTTQFSPGWALDRLNSSAPSLNNQYTYSNTGAGRTIYVLDSGLDLTNPTVAAEFGGRASIFWDVNGGTGADCNGHGSATASVAGGNVKGVAKGVTLKIAKITTGCTGSSAFSTSITAFNWLAANAPRGTIANWSHGISTGNCSISSYYTPLETAIIGAHNAGIIPVVAAGNDACNTANYSPTNIPQAFVVGATTRNLFNSWDEKASFSRTGWNISNFAPGENINAINQAGASVVISGTSFSAPYTSGLFAVACQAAGTFCNTASTADMFTALRNTGTLGTVRNTGGAPLTGATSRFIWQQW